MLLDFPLSVGSGNFRFFPSGKGEGAVFLQYFFALSREGDLDFIAHSSIIQRYSALRPQSTAKPTSRYAFFLLWISFASSGHSIRVSRQISYTVERGDNIFQNLILEYGSEDPLFQFNR